MKKYLIFLFFIVGGGFASATVQNQANPDKPATIEVTRTTWNQTGKFLDFPMQATWTYEGQWSPASGGYIKNQDGENGPEGNASVTGDYYSLDTNGSAISGYSFWQANACDDPGENQSGSNALSSDELQQAEIISMRKGALAAGANIDPGCEWPSNLYLPIAYENDSADCTVILHTGGKSSINRQNLFDLSGSATAITPPSENYGDWGGSSNVPPTSIQIAGQSLGNDGNLWIMLPDNADIDVTPQAPVPYYNFSVGATKYHPYITVNGTDLDDQTPTFIVGQSLNFVLAGLPTSQIVNMVGQWNLPGTFVNEGYLYSPTCTSFELNPSLLLNTDTTFCWYQNQPGGKVVVGMNLLFDNGQTATIAADGSINVVKPTIANFVPSPLDVSFNTNSDSQNNNSVQCSCGFSTQVQVPYPFSGQAQYVQLIQVDANYGSSIAGVCSSTTDTTSGDFWLDNTDPYPDPNSPWSVAWNNNPLVWLQHSDVPGYGPTLCDSVSVNENFKTYLQFQPSGGIPVTIGRIDWGWSCSYTENGGIWSGTSSTYGPTMDSSDDSFPVWSNVYHNSLF